MKEFTNWLGKVENNTLLQLGLVTLDADFRPGNNWYAFFDAKKNPEDQYLYIYKTV